MPSPIPTSRSNVLYSYSDQQASTSEVATKGTCTPDMCRSMMTPTRCARRRALDDASVSPRGISYVRAPIVDLATSEESVPDPHRVARPEIALRVRFIAEQLHIGRHCD